MAVKRLLKNSSRVMSYIDLNDYGLNEVPEDRQQTTKAQVGEFVVSRIKRSLRGLSSPVQGEGFKSTLSDSYKAYKIKQGAGSSANLRLFGDLLNSLTYEVSKSPQLGIGHTGLGRDGRPNARKCVGHCHFENSTLPRRRYLPDRGQSYKKSIEEGIQNIVNENKLISLEDVQLGDDILSQVFDEQSLLDLLAASTL